ncbi:MAG: hypothetical protein ABI882_19915 [Acidobacteriota bacterium]
MLGISFSRLSRPRRRDHLHGVRGATVAPEVPLTRQLLSFPIPGPSAVVNADLDKDHNQDLAIVSYTTNSVYILFGARGRVAFSRSKSYAVGQGPSGIVVADHDW